MTIKSAPIHASGDEKTTPAYPMTLASIIEEAERATSSTIHATKGAMELLMAWTLVLYTHKRPSIG